MKRIALPLFAALLLAPLSASRAADATKSPGSLPEFKAKLQATMTRHLDPLISNDGSIVTLKGKSAEGSGAMAFYLMFEATGEQRYRKAAVSMADQILKEMRATKFGVLPIKERRSPAARRSSAEGRRRSVRMPRRPLTSCTRKAGGRRI